jgi:hypothetical protein
MGPCLPVFPCLQDKGLLILVNPDVIERVVPAFQHMMGLPSPDKSCNCALQIEGCRGFSFRTFWNFVQVYSSQVGQGGTYTQTTNLCKHQESDVVV